MLERGYYRRGFIALSLEVTDEMLDGFTRTGLGGGKWPSERLIRIKLIRIKRYAHHRYARRRIGRKSIAERPWHGEGQGFTPQLTKHK